MNIKLLNIKLLLNLLEFTELEISQDWITNNFVLKMDYFYTSIEVTFNNKSAISKQNYTCSVHIRDLKSHSAIEFSSKNEIVLFNKVIKIIASTLRTKKFAIQNYGKGDYRLFDPDGFDYSCEYLALDDAKRTCHHHFKMI